MTSSFLAAVGAAVCFGTASVLQKLGVRHAATDGRFSPALLAAFIRQRNFAVGVGLDAIGFMLNLWALRRLPLFLVQPVVASAVAVTALLGSRVLGERLGRSSRAAIVGIVAGLTMVAASAVPETASSLGPAGRVLLGAGAPLLAAVAALADRVSAGRQRGIALSVFAGLGFAGFGVAGRFLQPPYGVTRLVADPLAWAVVVYAVLGVTLFGTALQRGSATSVSTVAMVTETLVPTAVGLLLGDHARPDLAGVAVAGYLLSFLGIAVLVRDSHASPSPPRDHDARGSSPPARPFSAGAPPPAPSWRPVGDGSGGTPTPEPARTRRYHRRDR